MTVWFDESRRRYRVRRRRGGQDERRNVPRDWFAREGIPHDRPSRRGAEIAKQYLASTLGGEVTGKHAPTLERLFEAYKAANPNDVRDEKTWTRQGQYLAALVEFFRDRDPSEIDLHDAMEYRNERRKTRRARTVRAELFFLQALLRYGYSARRKTGMRELNLLDVPTVTPDDDQRGIALTEAEIALLMDVRLDRDTLRFRRVVAFGICTGLRHRPLMAFERSWSREGWAHVPGRLMKGRRPHEVPLNATALHILSLSGSRYAFPSFKGTPVTYWPWDRSIGRHHEEWGVRKFTPHDLRRTFATLLEQRGVPKSVIADLLGHTGGTVTDRYVRSERRERMEAAVALLDEVFSPYLGNFLGSRRPNRPRK